MTAVTRRSLFRYLGFLVIGGVIGCLGIEPNQGIRSERNPRIRVSPGIERSATGWKMSSYMRHYTDRHASIHGVIVVAFNTHGEEICRDSMGDFPQHGRYEATKTIDCDEFPAIVTATAEESPCDGAQIRMLYYTSEENPETVDDLGHHSLWEGRWRDCDEELPPEHVVEKVRQSGAATVEE